MVQKYLLALPQAIVGARPLQSWHSEERRSAAFQAIERHLDATDAATAGRSPLKVVMSPVDWWRGTSIEYAFRSLHAARIMLVDVQSDDEVTALIPDAVARVESCLFPIDPRRIEVERLPGQRDPALRRAELRHALQMGYSASDESHGRLRAFRNVLLAAAALIAVFMICFVVLVVRPDPAAVPLCFHPEVSAMELQARNPSRPIGDFARRDVCPSREAPAGARQEATAGDVGIIAGLGLLGGALASAVSIRKMSGTSTPYGVPVALALLKVPPGALTAVAGIILLGGAFVPGLSNLDSQSQILAYALVLGYAQQLATRFIDQRASDLMDQIPSKYSAKAPTTSVASEPGSPHRRR